MIEPLEDRLHREKEKVRLLEQMIERKTRELYMQHQKSEQSSVFLNSILQSLSAGLIVMDMSYRILLVNESAVEMTHLPQEELRGLSLFDSFPLEINGKAFTQDNCHENMIDQFEACLLQRDADAPLPVSCSFSQVQMFNGQRGIICLIQDISEMKRLERQLTRAQKLESVGQLAAGIAHEINTPIQYLRDNTLFMKDEFLNIKHLLTEFQRLLEVTVGFAPAESLRSEILSMIKKIDLPYLVEEIPMALSQSFEGAESVARIVRSMKSFSHPGSVERSLTDINEAIESTVTVSRNEWKYVSEVKLNLASNLPQVECFPGELNQVLLNLIINAAHAICAKTNSGKEGRGTITITTCMLGDSVEVGVSDTGTGIPKEIREKIFDPFFTTKEVGKGTGQGLAMVYDVITKRHGGTFTATNIEEGSGAEFALTLPLMTQTSHAAASV